MLLHIVRHGQSTGNISTDDIPDAELTPLGQQQVRETALYFADKSITHVHSSPLVRAMATGSAIAAAAGLRQVEVWPELQEHRYSLHRGFGRPELLQRFPLAVFSASVEAEGWDHGGETYESALERGIAAIAALRERHATDDRVVVATHGAFANCLLRAVFHTPPALRLYMPINNCSISQVRFVGPHQQPADDYYPADVEVFCVNAVSHLSEVS